MYKLIESGVQRLSDGASIPNWATNRDWIEYQKWLAEGNIPEPQYTVDEFATKLIAEVNAEASIRAKELTKQIPSRRFKLLRKEFKGVIGQKEEAELDLYDLIDDQIDAIDTKKDNAENWITNPARTLDELEAYNPKIDPWT